MRWLCISIYLRWRFSPNNGWTPNTSIASDRACRLKWLCVLEVGFMILLKGCWLRVTTVWTLPSQQETTYNCQQHSQQKRGEQCKQNASTDEVFHRSYRMIELLLPAESSGFTFGERCDGVSGDSSAGLKQHIWACRISTTTSWSKQHKQ